MGTERRAEVTAQAVNLMPLILLVSKNCARKQCQTTLQER